MASERETINTTTWRRERHSSISMLLEKFKVRGMAWSTHQLAANRSTGPTPSSMICRLPKTSIIHWSGNWQWSPKITPPDIPVFAITTELRLRGFCRHKEWYFVYTNWWKGSNETLILDIRNGTGQLGLRPASLEVSPRSWTQVSEELFKFHGEHLEEKITQKCTFFPSADCWSVQKLRPLTRLFQLASVMYEDIRWLKTSTNQNTPNMGQLSQRFHCPRTHAPWALPTHTRQKTGISAWRYSCLD